MCRAYFSCKTRTERDENKLEPTEMRIWRRIMKVSWTEMKSDLGVLVGEKRTT